MDAIMRESSFAQYLKEQFKEQFIEKGIEQGIEQGIERGVRERAVEDILSPRNSSMPCFPPPTTSVASRSSSAFSTWPIAPLGRNGKWTCSTAQATLPQWSAI